MSSNAVENFNNLTPAQTESLALVTEECGEASQAVGKILRHGLFSTNPANGQTNLDHLTEELGQILAIVEIGIANGVVDRNFLNVSRDKKLKTILKYIHHAKIPDCNNGES